MLEQVRMVVIWEVSGGEENANIADTTLKYLLI